MTTIYKTANEWLNSTHVLAENQMGVEIDSGKLKLGDGICTWRELNYAQYLDYIGKEKSFVTPENFGELGDDDTVIIQAALNSGKNVKFTSGVTYNIDGELTVPSDIVISGHGAKINLTSNVNVVKKVFKVEDYTKNVIFDGLNFFANRNMLGVKIGNDTTEFNDSNRESISLYQGVENIIIRNCAFNGVTYCVRLQEHSTTAKDPIWRRNIVIENLWAEDVSCAIDGGRETDGIFMNNIHIETSVESTQKHHAIYLRTDLKNVRIKNFYIKQYTITGTPVFFCSTRDEIDGESNPELDTVLYGEPIYLSHGEIYGESMGTVTNPYLIYADNVRFVNNDTDTLGSVFTHKEESFGYYNNCTFENCYQIRNGMFTDCRFKLYPGSENGLIFNSGKTKKKYSEGTFEEGMINVNLSDVERTILKNCTIDTNNAASFINIQKMNDNRETGNPHLIKFKNCIIENSAEYPVAIDILIYTSPSINTPYTIIFDDCSFDALFNKDQYHTDINDGTNGSLDIKFRRCSLKTDQSGFVKTPGNKVTKTYTLCDLNGNMM